MRLTLLRAGLATLTLPLLVSCAAPSRSSEASDLEGALTDLPGVAEVDLDYTEPIVLDSGKVVVKVKMDAAARPADVPEVVTTAFAAFSGPHHGEEGDVFVSLGDHVVHLRSFEPDAEVDDVAEVVTRALDVLDAGAVEVDIDTQDADQEPYIFTDYSVTVATDDVDRALRTLTELERRHGGIADAGWSVLTTGENTWEFGASSGFPGAEQRALFARLRKDLPSGASLQLVDDFVTVQVPARATTDDVVAMVDRHLVLLGGVEEAFYDVTSGEHFYAMLSAGDCTFADGEVGARLKADHDADCSAVRGEDEPPS